MRLVKSEGGRQIVLMRYQWTLQDDRMMASFACFLHAHLLKPRIPFSIGVYFCDSKTLLIIVLAWHCPPSVLVFFYSGNRQRRRIFLVWHFLLRRVWRWKMGEGNDRVRREKDEGNQKLIGQLLDYRECTWNGSDVTKTFRRYQKFGTNKKLELKTNQALWQWTRGSTRA